MIITNTSVIPWGALVANNLEVDHIWNIREFMVQDHGLNPITSFPNYSKYIYYNSEKIWFVSSAVRKEYEKFMPKDKSSTIYSHITIPRNSSNEKVANPFKHKQSFRAIMPSFVNQGKGQLHVCKAFLKLIAQGSNVELLLLGQYTNTPYLTAIRTLISNSNGRIHLMKFQKNPYPYIKMSDIVISGSAMEAFSRTLVEAGLLRKTVIVTSRGGNKELVTNGINGLTYRYPYVNQLCNQVNALNSDRVLYKKLCHNHYLECRKYSNPKKYWSRLSFPNHQTHGRVIRKILLSTLNNIYSQQIKEQKNEIESRKTEVGKLTDQLGNLKNYTNQLQQQLDTIKSSKTYIIWQRFSRLRNIIANILIHR